MVLVARGIVLQKKITVLGVVSYIITARSSSSFPFRPISSYLQLLLSQAFIDSDLAKVIFKKMISAWRCRGETCVAAWGVTNASSTLFLSTQTIVS